MFGLQPVLQLLKASDASGSSSCMLMIGAAMAYELRAELHLQQVSSMLYARMFAGLIFSQGV